MIDRFNDVTILFVITLDGRSMRKYSLLPNQQLCFLEQVELKPPTIPDNEWKVNRAELIAETVRESPLSLTRAAARK